MRDNRWGLQRFHKKDNLGKLEYLQYIIVVAGLHDDDLKQIRKTLYKFKNKELTNEEFVIKYRLLKYIKERLAY